MNYQKKFFYSPGGEDGYFGSLPDKDEDQKVVSGEPEAGKEHKPIIEKIKEALQEWSNKDEADQEFDDTRV